MLITFQIKTLELKLQDTSSMGEDERNKLYFEHAKKSRECQELLDLWESKSSD